MALPAGYAFPDLSGYVNVTDWDRFARSYPVAICKVSEGVSFGSSVPGKPNYWPIFLENCRKRGIYPIGYHFLRREGSVQDQAANFLRRLDGGPVGIALDIEKSELTQTSPTVLQAHEWFNLAAGATGIPRSRMASYMGRGWYQANGAGLVLLRDTIWWLPHYTSSPNLGPMAGWPAPRILQFGSAIPGQGMPPGDMNIAVNMTAAQLRALFTGGAGDVPLDTADKAYLKGELDDIRDRIWDVRYIRADDVGHKDANLETVGHKIDDLSAKVDFVLKAVGARFDSLGALTEAIAKAIAGALPAADGDLSADDVKAIADAVATRLYSGPDH